MSKEGHPLQSDMFTDRWVDNRTRRQRKLDHERERRPLKQTEMFSQRELAQFGVRARPLMDLHPGCLQLIREDPRTPEEIEADRMREAQRLTTPMFNDESSKPSQVQIPIEIVGEKPTSKPLTAIGLRKTQRIQHIRVRRRNHAA